MKLQLRLDEKQAMQIENEAGKKLELGSQSGDLRPMQLLPAALASCSTIDVLHILEKQRLQVQHYAVEIEAERREEKPQIFSRIELVFRVSEDIPRPKLQRAIELSLQSYCSVAAILRASGCQITYRIENY